MTHEPAQGLLWDNADPAIGSSAEALNHKELADTFPPSPAHLLRCSKCRLMLHPEQFSPKRYHQTTHITANGEDVTYRSPCGRGRHYHCRKCQRDAYYTKHHRSGRPAGRSRAGRPDRLSDKGRKP